MKVELISNVSHDLKTPLTSIISYAGLLSQEDGLPEHVRDYIRILNEKAGRLSTMVKDVFDVSKAASGSLPVKQERLDLGKLLRQTLADMAEEIGGSGLVLKTQLPEDPVPVLADGDRLYLRAAGLLFRPAAQRPEIRPAGLPGLPDPGRGGGQRRGRPEEHLPGRAARRG